MLYSLPNAPSMKVYCLYGHGKETEVSYWRGRGSVLRSPAKRSYWYMQGEYEQDESTTHGSTQEEQVDFQFCTEDQAEALVPERRFRPVKRCV